MEHSRPANKIYGGKMVSDSIEDESGEQKHHLRDYRISLEKDVAQLQKKLRQECNTKNALKRAFRRTLGVLPHISPGLSPKIQKLLAEVAVLEEEVVNLEEHIVSLRQGLYNEAAYLCSIKGKRSSMIVELLSPLKLIKAENYFIDTAVDGICFQPSTVIDSLGNAALVVKVDGGDVANALSEEMVYCLSGIFLMLARPSSVIERDMPTCVSCARFSSAWSMTSSSCNGFTQNSMFLDPYGISSCSVQQDIGPYGHYKQVSFKSLDYSRIPRCADLLKRLMSLMKKLSMVDLQGLSHQEKLAFWINIYNACMMHAFLEHGIPNRPDKVAALMGKAMLNVGGHSLSALAIEHFILRLPADIKNTRQKQIKGIIRSTYGLECSEPLVTFALCCGSFSSPVVKVYSPEHIEEELELAKREYLQAAVGVMSSRVVIPKLLEWYMRDFAKNVECLTEWISEQLPSTLSESIKKCMASWQGVEVVPYDFSFRYLFAMSPSIAYS